MRLFLSYAREDLALGERLAAALLEREIEVLWDRDLSPALDYSEQLRAMIRSADSFAVLLTPHSVSSSECRAEMDHAIELGKRLVPVAGSTEVPPERLPDAIRKVQWCLWTDAGGVSSAAAQIQEALRTNFELVPIHTRLLNRVEEWRTRDRTPGLLLRDPFLKEAEDWLMRAALAEQLPQPTDLQREYLSTSRAAEIRTGVTFRRRAMAGIVGLIGIVVNAHGRGCGGSRGQTQPGLPRGRRPWSMDPAGRRAIPRDVRPEVNAWCRSRSRSRAPSKRRTTRASGDRGTSCTDERQDHLTKEGGLLIDLQENGRLIGGNDLWIAATALADRMPVVTRNVEHFRRVPGLEVEEYLAWRRRSALARGSCHKCFLNRAKTLDSVCDGPSLRSAT